MNDEPLWYKDALIYEVHVKSFFDSNGDGIGDFRGLTAKLDYLQDLGVTALWLLPFFPSPLKDDGYDIADYCDVNPIYGTLGDFKVFIKEAHARGIRVLVELVLNHTSDQHPWFQAARRAPKGSPEREFYVWNDSPEKYQEARIIFNDYETSNWQWDPVANSYYWHRFYHHQPDLNFENPQVHKELLRVLSFWLDLGVDGFRLDAVPYLYEKEGTNCENLLETHAFLKTLRKKIDRRFQSRIFLAEANQWPEEAAHYFGNDDECHAAFHFPMMPRLYMALHLEDRYPIIDIAKQTPPIPEKSQWALFLRNHDELTLEMITDEEREEMYRAYAPDPRARFNLGIRRRLAPLLKNDRRRLELMNALLLSLMGTPVIYYGDEIGMGDNIYLDDRHGVRTPMQWNSSVNAGFSQANPQRLYLPLITDPEYHYQTVNVKVQEENPTSLLNWMRHLITVRKRHASTFGRGTIEFLFPQNTKVLAYFRTYQNERLLVVVNLSRTSQPVSLNLKDFAGQVPVDLLSDQPFPEIGNDSYNLTLGPYGFYWFEMRPKDALQKSIGELPLVLSKQDWSASFSKEVRWKLENLLADYLLTRPWHGKGQRIDKIKIVSDFILFDETTPEHYHLLCLNVIYHGGNKSTYLLPLALSSEKQENAFCHWKDKTVDAILYEPCDNKGFFKALFSLFHTNGTEQDLGHIKPSFIMAPPALAEPSYLKSLPECLILEGETWLLKFFYRLEDKINPDVEVSKFLTKETAFKAHFPLSGTLDAYMPASYGPCPFFEVLNCHPFCRPFQEMVLEKMSKLWESSSEEEKQPFVLLGKQLAEFHQALASGNSASAFAPEPFTLFYQRSVYQTLRKQISKTLALLHASKERFAPEDLPLVQQLLDREAELLDSLRPLIQTKFHAMRQRLHGNCTIDNILFNGTEFYFSNFHGLPETKLDEKRAKGTPLRDVAQLLVSLRLFPLKEEGLKHAKTWVLEGEKRLLQAYLSKTEMALPSAQIDFLLNIALQESYFRTLAAALNTKDIFTAKLCIEQLL